MRKSVSRLFGVEDAPLVDEAGAGGAAARGPAVRRRRPTGLVQRARVLTVERVRETLSFGVAPDVVEAAPLRLTHQQRRRVDGLLAGQQLGRPLPRAHRHQHQRGQQLAAADRQVMRPLAIEFNHQIREMPPHLRRDR